MLALGCGPTQPMAENDGESGESETGDTGDGDLAELPPELPPLSCWDETVVAFAEFDGYLPTVWTSPCGYVRVTDETQANAWFLGPSGTPVLLDPHPSATTTTWDMSGRYGAYHTGSEAVLYDLRTHETRVTASPLPIYGFVPSLDPQVGSWFWTCSDGELSIHTIAESRVLATSVTCESVSGSFGGPWLTYATQDGTIWAFDCDQDDMPSAVGSGYVFEIIEGNPEVLRADDLRFDHDGRRIVHSKLDYPSLSPEPHALGHDIYSVAEATVMQSFGPESLAVFVGWGRGAPLIVVGSPTFVIGDAEPIDIGQPITWFWSRDDGEVWILQPDELSVTVDRGTSLITLIELDAVSDQVLQVGPNHAAVLTNDERDLWVIPKDGPAPSEPTARSLVPWEVQTVFTDGTTLAIGALEANGGAVETLLIRPDGSVLAAGPHEDDPMHRNSTRRGFELVDGRYMAGTDNAEQQVWIVDPDDGSSLTVGPQGRTSYGASNDRRVIVVNEGYGFDDDPDGFWYGAPPL